MCITVIMGDFRPDILSCFLLPDEPVISIALRVRALTTVTVRRPAVGK